MRNAEKEKKRVQSQTFLCFNSKVMETNQYSLLQESGPFLAWNLEECLNGMNDWAD